MLSKVIICSTILALSTAVFAADENIATSLNQPISVSTTSTNTAQEPTVVKKTSHKHKKAHKEISILEKVNINKDEEQKLAKVKGIGPKKAKAIIDYRVKNGNFKSIDDLLNVKTRGINKKFLKKVSDHLTV
jgi:comEA protein